MSLVVASRDVSDRERPCVRRRGAGVSSLGENWFGSSSIIRGLDMGPSVGEDMLKPRLAGEDSTKLGEMVFWNSTRGEGREDVGLSPRRAAGDKVGVWPKSWEPTKACPPSLGLPANGFRGGAGVWGGHCVLRKGVWPSGRTSDDCCWELD